MLFKVKVIQMLVNLNDLDLERAVTHGAGPVVTHARGQIIVIGELHGRGGAAALQLSHAFGLRHGGVVVEAQDHGLGTLNMLLVIMITNEGSHRPLQKSQDLPPVTRLCSCQVCTPGLSVSLDEASSLAAQNSPSQKRKVA